MGSLLVALALLASSPLVDVARIPIDDLTSRAESGDPQAMAELGARHLSGVRGAVRRHTDARRWCEAARAATAKAQTGAVNGRAEACLNVSSGPETPCVELIARAKAAADTGDAYAMIVLASLLDLAASSPNSSVDTRRPRYGRSCATSWAKRPPPAGKAQILELLTAAARLGHPEAEANLALKSASAAEDAIVAAEALIARGNTDAAALLGAGMLQSVNPQRKRRAIELLALAASAGNSQAIGALLDCYSGHQCDANDAERKAVFDRGLSMGEPRCVMELAVATANGDGQPLDPARAVVLAEPIAFDEPIAANLASRGYCYGIGAAQDDARCLAANLARAHFDDPDGLFDLAVNTINGDGRSPDPTEAARLYERASGLGHARAANNLGLMYQKGEGVPLDLARAFEWYTLAAERNDAEGWNNVGAMLAGGLGRPEDREGAVAAWRKGAALGGHWAMSNLATALAKGHGVERDIDSAIEWYRKAADAGHAPSASRLAEILLSGDVPLDVAAAAAWAQQAADKGDRVGCAVMARLHFWGWGVPRDPKRVAAHLECAMGIVEADVIRAEIFVRMGKGDEGLPALQAAAARGLADARLTLVRLALTPDLGATLQGEAPKQDLDAARRWLDDGVALAGDEADAYRAVLAMAGGEKDASTASLERIAARSPLAGVQAALAILSLPASDRALAKRLLAGGQVAQIGIASEVLDALGGSSAAAPTAQEPGTLLAESEKAFRTGESGLEALEAASRSGFAPATCRLGFRLALGAGVDVDRARGLTLLSKDCEPLLLAEALLVGTNEEKARAEALLRDRVTSGDARAAILLGRAYTDGRLAPPSPNAATPLFEQAAAKGDADGRAWLGRSMLTVDLDAALVHLRAAEEAGSCDGVALRTRAMKSAEDPESPGGNDRLMRCAEAGHPDSAYLIGRELWRSEAPRSRDIGRRLLRIASNGGHGEATYNLAVAFREGVGGEPRDVNVAARLFERSLASGYLDAAYNLGRLYQRGEGVPRDLEKALSLFLSCSKIHGDCAGSAANILLLLNKPGSTRFGEGIAMLEKAVEMGNANASARLAMVLSQGDGVARDVPRATALLVNAARLAVPGSYAALVYLASRDELQCEGKPLETWLEEQANSGRSDAAEALGTWRVAQGRPKEALRFLAAAAMSGQVDAERAFAAALHGRKVPEGPSLEVLEAAVSKGDPEAMLELHRRLGSEPNADMERVKALVMAAADKGYAPAINRLAVGVRDGDITGQADMRRACELFARAADLGFAKAKLSFAECRAQGVSGPPATMDEVATLIRRAALGGAIAAQLGYGLARIRGEFGPPDSAKGREFLEMAASAGEVQAMLHLATLAEFGMVDEKDLASASAWLQFAEALTYGEERTQIQARVAALSGALDQKERARAEKLLATHWASLRKRWTAAE